jgi:hypothetical protein
VVTSAIAARAVVHHNTEGPLTKAS